MNDVTTKQDRKKRYSVSIYPRENLMVEISRSYEAYLKDVDMTNDVTPHTMSGFLLSLIRKELRRRDNSEA